VVELTGASFELIVALAPVDFRPFHHGD